MGNLLVNWPKLSRSFKKGFTNFFDVILHHFRHREVRYNFFHFSNKLMSLLTGCEQLAHAKCIRATKALFCVCIVKSKKSN